MGLATRQLATARAALALAGLLADLSFDCARAVAAGAPEVRILSLVAT
jgi:hypothetical protein